MYDDYGTTTYIELCTFSIMYRSTKIDSNWLKHPVLLILFIFYLVLPSYIMLFYIIVLCLKLIHWIIS
jgi:hypothetical protein